MSRAAITHQVHSITVSRINGVPMLASVIDTWRADGSKDCTFCPPITRAQAMQVRPGHVVSAEVRPSVVQAGAQQIQPI